MDSRQPWTWGEGWNRMHTDRSVGMQKCYLCQGSMSSGKSGYGLTLYDRPPSSDSVGGALSQQEPRGQKTGAPAALAFPPATDRKSTRLNSSHLVISYAVF